MFSSIISDKKPLTYIPTKMSPQAKVIGHGLMTQAQRTNANMSKCDW